MSDDAVIVVDSIDSVLMAKRILDSSLFYFDGVDTVPHGDIGAGRGRDIGASGGRDIGASGGRDIGAGRDASQGTRSIEMETVETSSQGKIRDFDDKQLLSSSSASPLLLRWVGLDCEWRAVRTVVSPHNP